MNAEQIANKINLSPWKPKGVTVVCRFINGSEVKLRGNYDCKDDTKCDLAWKTLFGTESFEDTISYINNVWLDPSYHFYIVK
ncbi:MAG: hypothetical protein WCK91_00855 [bacterium]